MLDQWLTEVMAQRSAPVAAAGGQEHLDTPVIDDEVVAARERIHSAVADAGLTDADLTGTDAPITLGDTTVRHLVSCEGLAVASAHAEPPEVTWPMLRGRALDAFVEHALFAGPVADAEADLRSMWAASESIEDLALLERFASTETAPGSDTTVAGDLAELAANAMCFSGTRPWAPRTEVRMAAGFGGALELRGRVDVVFGGPGTGLPVVLVEVKSGRLRDEHRAQLRHYILLAALRHGELPTGAALWSPVSGLEPLYVPGVLAGAAERVAAAVVSLARIRAGRAPVLRSGAHCRFCPASAQCPAAQGDSAGLQDHVWDDSDAFSDDFGPYGASLVSREAGL